MERGHVGGYSVNIVSVRGQHIGCGIEILRVHVGKHDGASRSEAMCDRRSHAAGADDDNDAVTQFVCPSRFSVMEAACFKRWPPSDGRTANGQRPAGSEYVRWA